MKSRKKSFLLVLAAFIWGSAFTAQSVGMNYIGPFTFNMIRMIIGGMVLLPVIFLTRKKSSSKTAESSQGSGSVKQLLTGGAVCGVVLFIASTFQQIGLVYTSPGKSGFITALYVVLVPVAGLFMKKRPSKLLWISVLLAIAGMYLLCLSGDLSINKGDLLTFFCAIFFTLHIIVIDEYSPKVNGIALSAIQFFVAGLLSAAVALFSEKIDPGACLDAWIPLLYAGVLSCGVAFTLQIIGQKSTPPVVASLLMSLESVFSVLVAWFFGSTLTGREVLGCAIMFIAIILAQLPTDIFKKYKVGA